MFVSLISDVSCDLYTSKLAFVSHFNLKINRIRSHKPYTIVKTITRPQVIITWPNNI